jgi:hypothetical protein
LCGCFEGFVRFKGKCIAKSECPKSSKCGKNEVFDVCVKPLKCQIGCKKHKHSSVCRNRKCKPGCRCEKGFVRNDNKNNKCVKRKFCHFDHRSSSSELKFSSSSLSSEI